MRAVPGTQQTAGEGPGKAGILKTHVILLGIIEALIIKLIVFLQGYD